MKITGKHSIQLTRETVWTALLDPDVIAQALPGCDRLTRTGEHAYEAQINVRIGPVTGTFESRFSLEDLAPPESYRLKVHGQGQAGFLDATGEIRLEEDGESTLLHYDMDASVGGRVASVGQRLLESTGRVMARQGLKRLDSELQKRSQQEALAVLEPEEPPALTVTEGEPSQERPAGAALSGEPDREDLASVAETEQSDLPDLAPVPDEVSPQLPSGNFTPGRLIIGLLAAALLGFALLRACV